MTDYTLNWSDNILKAPFTLSGSSINTTATSLTLTGKGSVNWGEPLQENLLHLLENFASNGTQPANPTTGQLWFDTSTTRLKVFKSSTPSDLLDLQYRNIGAASAPSTPIVGDLWYDTVNSLLKVYNGTSWASLNPSVGATGVQKTNNGRLTLVQGSPNDYLPVTVNDVTGANYVYFERYDGDLIALYDGINWQNYTIPGFLSANPIVSAMIPNSTTPTGMYDVYIGWTGSALTLSFDQWLTDTTRNNVPIRRDGVWCRLGDLTKRYLGSLYSAPTTDDSAAKRNLWNYYHRQERVMRVVESTDTWSYTSNAWRQANGSTANQLEFVIGIQEEPVWAKVIGQARNNSASLTTTGILLLVGIGLDSSVANSAQIFASVDPAFANDTYQLHAEFFGFVGGVGRHTLRWIEQGGPSIGITTWTGDNLNGYGNGTTQSGIIGSLRC